MFTNYPDNPAFDDFADTAREAAELRDVVAALTAELEQVSAARNTWAYKHAQVTAELDHLRDVLNRVYAERDNAHDDADALRNRYRAARKIAARRRVERRLAAPVAAQPAPASARVVKMDMGGAYYSSVGATCPDCAPAPVEVDGPEHEGQICEHCDGMGAYSTAIWGIGWETYDCPQCGGVGAYPGTPEYQRRVAKHEADQAEAQRRAALEDIPF